jgi:diguanylate cyclase (GGDEF)-like protein
MMSNTSGVKRYAMLAAIAALYFIVGRLSLQLASAHPSASPVWPPTGIALALVLLLSVRVWPAIFVGAFLVNLATAGNLMTSLGIAAGNTIEAMVGGLLVWRYAGGHETLVKVPNLFRFVLLAALLSTTISATLGVGSLTLGGFADTAAAPAIWLTWWLGDATGALIVAPLILAWAARDGPRVDLQRIGEAVALGVALVVVSQVVFGDLFGLAGSGAPLGFLCVPLMLWAALRFELRGAATANAVLALLAVLGTLRGFGPFAAYPLNESLLLLQAYLGVSAVTALMVAAVVGERREIEERLRHLAVSDSLTGLANYRMMIDRLHAEIARTRRTGHAFVVLFMDLDGLKKINDSQGHVTGNRALLRLAKALKESCRSIDLVARFGGDEFVVVMPESDEASAGVLERRIEARLAHSTEKPPIRFSSGVAVHPRDGDSPEDLLKAADGRLYEARRRLRGSDPPTRRDDISGAAASATEES